MATIVTKLQLPRNSQMVSEDSKKEVETFLCYTNLTPCPHTREKRISNFSFI